MPDIAVAAVPTEAAAVAAEVPSLFLIEFGLVRSGFFAVASLNDIPDSHFCTRNPGQALVDMRLWPITLALGTL